MKQCRKCLRTLDVSEFYHIARSNRPQEKYVHSRCKDCERERSRAAGSLRTYEQRREQQLKYKYGLTPEDVERMLAEQGGVCDICKEVPNPPVVDHCHTTGLVRGILCIKCNSIIGYALDSIDLLKSAIYYLEQDL